MSQSESRRPFVPPFAAASRSDDLDDDLLETTDVSGEGIFRREGLPQGYRMRHDAHYVDQLASRAGGAQVRLIPVRDIEVARVGEPVAFEPLVSSIGRCGVLQPLLVRSRGGRFELIAGARRLAAATAAGLTEVPCLVHACDDARARALAEADNVRGVEPAPPPQPATAQVPPGSLRELRQSVSTIDSCLHLLAEQRSLRDRVALDLIRTEAYRAERLVEALGVLTEEPLLAAGPRSMRTTVERALEALEPERRLAGVHVNLEIAEGAHVVDADPHLLDIAVPGLLGALLALVQPARLPALWVKVSTAPSEASVVLDVSQQAVTLPQAAIARFFDAHWTDREGGYQAAMALAAARRVCELHKGGLEVLAGETGGCRVLMMLPAAR